MQLWTMWLESLREILEFLSSEVGLGLGLAVIALTLAIRLALLPVSWSCAYRACLHQKKVRKLQPELARLRERFSSQPQLLFEETMKLYRRRGVPYLDTRPIVGALVQMPVLLGMFGMLRQGLRQARFLWIASLSRPDFWIALIAGVTTALMILANPELPQQARTFIVLIPTILAFVFALKFASALALYWVTSNCVTAIQTVAVHRLVNRRARLGRIQG